MKPKLSLVIGILCISLSPIFVRLAELSPITSAFYRIFIAWLCLAPYCIISRNLKIGRNELLIAVVGGLVFGVDIYVWNVSLFKISATISTLIANLAPVWVGLITFLLFKKSSGKLFWIGTAIAVTGMVVLCGFESFYKLQVNGGVFLALLASLLYAVYILITKDVLQKIATLTFMFYNMLAASLFLVLICLFQSNKLSGFSAQEWACLGGMGIICQLGGWLTINHSIRHLPSTKVSIALLSQTILAGIWAMFLLNEQLGLREITGSVIVLAGITVTFIKQKPATVKQSAA